MFYSHEILTSRKYGVATVWLVATLGAKSNTKKVTKKAILEVDVKKACETIIEPGAPMALRLQSNLLYGVSRVHSQQWDYLLTDTQSAQTAIRALLKITRTDALDLDAATGKARPQQLLLVDDPAFDLENSLQPPPAWLDFSNLELEPLGDSQRSSQSMLSIRERSGSVVSQDSSGRSILGLNIPSSSHGSYQLPMNDPFGGGSSAQKAIGIGVGPAIMEDEEELAFMDDDIFDFDADPQFRDLLSATTRPQLGRAESGSVVSPGKNDNPFANIGPPVIRDEDGDVMMQFNMDDDHQLPDAEPFPIMTGGLGGRDRPLHLNNPDLVFSDGSPSSSSSESVEAKAADRQRKPRQKKNLAPDVKIMMLNKELLGWGDGYLQLMAAESRAKYNQKVKLMSKKTAFQYVFGMGLNSVGTGVGSLQFPTALNIYSGNALLEKLTGVPHTTHQPKKGTKRAHTPSSDSSSGTPSKKSRSSEIARGNKNNFDDDMQNLNLNSSPHHYNADLDQSMEPEMARDAHFALPDRPSSAMMPWNVSASLNSHQKGLSSSIHGARTGGMLSSQFGSQPTRDRGRNRISAFPLIGRGSALLGDLQNFSQSFDNDDEGGMVMYGRSDNDSPSQYRDFGGYGGLGEGDVSASQNEEFEIFGAAAGVDTQTAQDSQWVREALDRESGNFFTFLQNTIEEKHEDDEMDELSRDDDDDDGFRGGRGKGREKSVTFEELFNPDRNSAMVAAQAFYHVLCLATKGRVWAVQDIGEGSEYGEGGWEAFGEIRIGCL